MQMHPLLFTKMNFLIQRSTGSPGTSGRHWRGMAQIAAYMFHTFAWSMPLCHALQVVHPIDLQLRSTNPEDSLGTWSSQTSLPQVSTRPDTTKVQIALQSVQKRQSEREGRYDWQQAWLFRWVLFGCQVHDLNFRRKNIWTLIMNLGVCAFGYTNMKKYMLLLPVAGLSQVYQKYFETGPLAVAL